MPVAARQFHHPKPIWIGTFLWLLHWLLALAALVVLTMTFLVSKSYGFLFLGLAIGYCVVFVLRWLQSRSVSCPLCHGKILHGSKCHKHRDARRFSLFTYTSSLFFDVVLSGKFTCMYLWNAVSVEALAGGRAFGNGIGGTPFRLKR